MGRANIAPVAGPGRGFRDGPVTIIGIDCAAQPSNCGLACGHAEGPPSSRPLRISRIKRGRGKGDFREVAATIRSWLETELADEGSVLLALDAPLGWPANMKESLSGHQAGQPLVANGRLVSGNDLFRRHADRFIAACGLGTPLDIGADRIARAARSALELLSELVAGDGAPRVIPLAWSPCDLEPGRVRAIEVYPKLTLRKLWGSEPPSYKRKSAVAKQNRIEIVNRLNEGLEIETDWPRPKNRDDDYDDDCIDAVLCVLEGFHFVSRCAVGPAHHRGADWAGLGPAYAGRPPEEIARQEGWIWFHEDLLPQGGTSRRRRT